MYEVHVRYTLTSYLHLSQTQILASHPNDSLGHRSHTDGCDSEPSGLLCRAILVSTAVDVCSDSVKLWRFQPSMEAVYPQRLKRVDLTVNSLGVTESGLFPGVVYYLSM